jgi:membrane-associated phospholipid phosphatase
VRWRGDRGAGSDAKRRTSVYVRLIREGVYAGRMLRTSWDRLPPLARAIVPGLLVTLIGIGGFLLILHEVLENDAFAAIDEPLLTWLADNRTPALTSVMTFVTNIFGPVVLPIIVTVGCALWGWRTRGWRDPILLAGAMILSTVLSAVVKALVERPRPDESLQVVPGYETSFSFPSGHSTGTATLVLVTAYLLWRRQRGWGALVLWAIASCTLISVVALTRMYLGYHFLSDVLAGAFLGLATLGIVIAVDRWLDVRASRGEPAPVR